MKLSRILGAVVLSMGLALGAVAADEPVAAPGKSSVHWLRINGIITHGTAAYVERGIRKAEDAGASAVVIELDTPGGVVDSTRDIVKSQLNARIPVVVWVGPRGARAGSAGVFITLAANVAVMAPGTNIGAAHPIGIGPPDFLPSGDDDDDKKDGTPAPRSTGAPGKPETESNDPLKRGLFKFRSDQEHLAEKIENDTLAWVEAIARERGRNVEWARDAVLNSVSIVAEDALKKNVIDLIAADRDEVLAKIDGMRVKTAAGERVIQSASQPVVDYPMTWREQLVSFLANPTLISILGLIVMLGLYAEFNHPGLIFPAVCAGIALLGLLVGVQVVPVNLAGLLLVLIGFVCFILEVKITSYGLLTIGGIVSIVLGLTLFVDERTFTVDVSWSVVVPALFATVGIAVGMTWLAVKAMASPPLGDSREFIGRIVKVTNDLDPEGTVQLDGTYWNAVSATRVAKGASVRIVDAKGLTLEVVPDDSGAKTGEVVKH